MARMAGRKAMTDLSPHIDLSVDAEGWREAVPGLETVISVAATAAMDAARPEMGGAEVSVLLTNDERMTELNENWRGKPGSTNVLSFPGELDGPGPVLLGDIAVAIETVTDEAQDARISVSDHLSHLIVHGTLHLLGYDHETDPEAETMERMETDILASLGIADPYASGQRQVTEVTP